MSATAGPGGHRSPHNREFWTALLAGADVALDPYHADFVFSLPWSFYRERVEMAGFAGLHRVLDVGCGIGQWSMALAECNASVIGVDRKPELIETAATLAERLGTGTPEFRVGALPTLDFPDGAFDGIWCWSVLQFVDREQALREFHRLLRPGGRLYVGCCNDRGRWLEKARDALRSRNSRQLRHCLRVVALGSRRGMKNNYTTLAEARGRANEFGFRCVAAGLDGHLDVTGGDRRREVFATRFLGLPNNVEFVWERND